MSNKVPFVARDVVAGVDLGLVAVEKDVQFESVVGPRAELHATDLFVEREVGDVDGAAGHVDGRGNPHHLAGALYDHHRITLFLQSLVGTDASRTAKSSVKERSQVK